MENKNLKNEGISNFGYLPNRINYYYKNVFKIEIDNLFFKKNEREMMNFDSLKNKVFDFYIVITDNNKKIFKTRLLKATFDKSNKNISDKNIGFPEMLYSIVDERLAKYCNKYLKNKTKKQKEKLGKIKDNDFKVNLEYQEWLENNRPKQ